MGKQPFHKKVLGTETGSQGSPIRRRKCRGKAWCAHDKPQPYERFTRGIRANTVNKKGKKYQDEIERKGHSELGERNEKNVLMASLNHILSDQGNTGQIDNASSISGLQLKHNISISKDDFKRDVSWNLFQNTNYHPSTDT